MAQPLFYASVSSVLSATETATTQGQSVALGTAAQNVMGTGKFVFFAAFDGTYNDRANLNVYGLAIRLAKILKNS